jgi:hypothetical protein
MPDAKQILEEVTEELRVAFERMPKPRSMEEGEKFHADLKAEIKAIAEGHGVPFQDWADFEHLKKQGAQLSQESPEELRKRAAKLDKAKP